MSRWSSERFTNLNIPNYIPPEAILDDEGSFLKAFLLRALWHDLGRISESPQMVADYFSRIEIVPEYDNQGNRTNTPEMLLQEKKMKAFEELTSQLKRHKEMLQGAVASLNKTEHVMKRFFTKDEMEGGAYGAILGARGSVHQSLEKETHCKIVLAGRGITDLRKDTSEMAIRAAQEEPHARIVGPSEKALQMAAQRIDWILSDDPQAVEFRENNRRKMAYVEGRQYVPFPKEAQGYTKPTSRTGEKRGREEEVDPTMDADTADFLKSF